VTSAVRYPVVELRQYTLRPGQRDVLIDLFDRELVESQEAEGMAIVGQFRDLDDPDRFVWIRGFADMPSRARALAAFYGGPAWQAHRAEANATMIDSDNVLLLRPVSARSGFPALQTARLPVGATSAEPARILVTLYYRDHPFDQAFADFFDRHVRPALIEAGATPLACLQTEHAENTFPALPVRTGENVFASLARFPSEARLDGYVRQARTLTTGASQQLRLAPTARSLLR
jgi:quinol monooxygenase YgiN